MIHTTRLVRTIGCLVMVLLLLTPASFADTDNPIETWFKRIETDFLDQRYMDMDGAYLGQCVDLAFFYADDIFEQKGFRETIGLGNANELYYTASREYFEPIPYDGTAPKVGDIIVWDFWGLGHVSVVFEVTDKQIKAYEQNSNSMGTAPVTIDVLEAPTYEYIGYQPIGYLRPRADKLGLETKKSPAKVNTEVFE